MNAWLISLHDNIRVSLGVIAGVISFLTILSLGFFFLFSNMLPDKRSVADDRIIIQIFDLPVLQQKTLLQENNPASEEMEALDSILDTERLTQEIASIPGIRDVDILDRADFQSSLAEWMNIQDWELPLPVLIEAETDGTHDASLLDHRIRDVIGEYRQVRIDDPRQWRSQWNRTLDWIRGLLVVFLIALLIIGASVIIHAVSAMSASRHRELVVLHILGATEDDILKRFGRPVLKALALGYLGAVIPASLALAMLVYFLDQSIEAQFSLSAIHVTQIGIMALLLPAQLGIGRIVTYSTIRYRLRSLEIEGDSS